MLAASLVRAEPVKIIFDTDMGNDVDDVMALCMLHTLQTRGAVELLAVTITKDHPQAAAFTDAVNTFYGRPDIPIGVVRNSPASELGRTNRYNPLADVQNEDGSQRYPHDLLSGEDAPEAVGLLRKLLAAAEDNSITLVQVGAFTNFQRLLASLPDTHSPLAGRELIAKKVKLLSVMGCTFQTMNWDTRFPEWNVRLDRPAAQALVEGWPTPIVWSGAEIGKAALFPREAIDRDFEYVKHHILKEAYILYKAPTPHHPNAPTWDPTAVLYAVYPDRGYFDLSPEGRVTVEDNGTNWFKPAEPGPHRFLVMTPEQAARVREAIIQLCVAPPAR
jgi:inosine-uridine nucleoside N-ribohydrolase